MTLKILEIENVKGIKRKSFNLDILPNKPSILVAPNGFGKSSLAIAFDSLQRNRINLDDDNFHESNKLNKPRINILYEKEDGSVVDLFADDRQNTISNEFEWFVINNKVRAKGIGQNFGGYTNVSASLALDPIILVDTIPQKVVFKYSYNQQKTDFGTNGKVLPNIANIFNNYRLLDNLFSNITYLDRSVGERIQNSINTFIQEVNKKSGSSPEILNWIETNKLSSLNQINYLKEITAILCSYNLDLPKLGENYLAAIQLIKVFKSNPAGFKNACKYKDYEDEKNNLKVLLSSINSSWKNIIPKETKKQLILEFPKTHLISNGQRDIICFIALLNKAKRKLRKQSCILIIDEIFDYLDDANLIGKIGHIDHPRSFS